MFTAGRAARGGAGHRGRPEGGCKGGFEGGFQERPRGFRSVLSGSPAGPPMGSRFATPSAAAVAGVAGAVAGPFQVPLQEFPKIWELHHRAVPLQAPEDRLNVQPMPALPPRSNGRSNGRSNSGGFPSPKDPSRIPDGSLREWPALPGRDAGYMPRTFGGCCAPGCESTSPPSIPPNHAKRGKYRQIQTCTADHLNGRPAGRGAQTFRLRQDAMHRPLLAPPIRHEQDLDEHHRTAVAASAEIGCQHRHPERRPDRPEGRHWRAGRRCCRT